MLTLTGLTFLWLTVTNRLQMNEAAIQFGIKLKSWVDIATTPITRIPYSEAIFGVILLAVLVYFVRTASTGGHET